MITLEQLQAAANAKPGPAAKFLTAINATMAKFNINTPIRQLCFLAQVGHESGGLFYTEELASGKAYEGRKDLGNTVAGYGVKYKGRGLIQITGLYNYAKLGKFMGVDLVNNPALLGGKNVTTCTPEQINNAAMSAGWFWDSRNLNVVADKMDISKPITDKNNMAQFVAITKKINGGTTHLGDRVARYVKGCPLLNI